MANIFNKFIDKLLNIQFIFQKVGVLSEYSPITLQVEGLNGIIFKETARLALAPAWKIWFQTDKYIYKPSDKVQFRIFLTDINTKPYDLTNTPIEVFILDAKKNRIKQWKNVQMQNGVFKGELKLPREPFTGYWSIIFYFGGDINNNYDYSQVTLIRLINYTRRARFDTTTRANI
jgi:hypothetical protein